jgi:hypothetical protein
MKTKAQIVQELLDKRYITAEDAVVLLSPDKEYIYLPQPEPVYPWNPYVTNPFTVTCGGVGNASSSININ